MKSKQYEKRGVCVVEIRGNCVGGPHADQFHKIFKSQLEAGQLRFIVDLSRTSFINSTGIGLVIRAFTSVIRKGGMLRLVAPQSSRSWAVLSIIQLFRIIEIFETLDEALTAFADDPTFPFEKAAAADTAADA